MFTVVFCCAGFICVALRFRFLEFDRTDDLNTLSSSQLLVYVIDLVHKKGFSQLRCKTENKSYDNDDDDDIFEWHQRQRPLCPPAQHTYCEKISGLPIWDSREHIDLDLWPRSH